MKRFHVHLQVNDLTKSIAFYSHLFATDPARIEADYAKWMLEDPRVNFAISTLGHDLGIDHLGIQAETEEELADLRRRAVSADRTVLDEGETVCCYSKSEKHWGHRSPGYRLGTLPNSGHCTRLRKAARRAVT